MQHFTPLSSLVGGVLIGLSAVFLLFALGRVLGVSGIFGGLVAPRSGDIVWRLLFVMGLYVGGLITSSVAPRLFRVSDTPSLLAVAVAGLLVGFGTRMGNGCTSGHGVCGVSRLAPRSIVATLTFMLAGMVTVFLSTHVFGAKP